MPASTSTKSLPYPVNTDAVSQGADAMRKLANSVDNMAQTGIATIDLSTADTNNTVTVTFPIAYAGNPGVVVAGGNAPAATAGASTYVWATGISPTGFTAGARRVGGLAGFTVRWISIGPVTTVA